MLAFTANDAVDFIHRSSGRFAISTCLLVASIIFCRRARPGAPARLQLIGAVAFFVAQLHDLAVNLLYSHQLVGNGSFLIPNCMENPMVTMPFDIIRAVGVCGPLGLCWYAYRATQRI